MYLFHLPEISVCGVIVMTCELTSLPLSLTSESSKPWNLSLAFPSCPATLLVFLTDLKFPFSGQLRYLLKLHSLFSGIKHSNNHKVWDEHLPLRPFLWHQPINRYRLRVWICPECVNSSGDTNSRFTCWSATETDSLVWGDVSTAEGWRTEWGTWERLPERGGSWVWFKEMVNLL